MVRFAARLLFGTAMLAIAAATPAQSYPAKPIRIIVPFATGGGVDLLTRVLAPHLAEQLGQPVIVDNRPGASANIGADLTAKAPPDGYTLLMASSIIAVNRSLMPKLPYDALKDFTFVARAGFAPSVLVCLPSFPAKSVVELIAVAKAKPDSRIVGTSGRKLTRCLLPTASARKRLAFTCGSTSLGMANMNEIWPPRRSLIAGAPPL